MSLSKSTSSSCRMPGLADPTCPKRSLSSMKPSRPISNGAYRLTPSGPTTKTNSPVRTGPSIGSFRIGLWEMFQLLTYPTRSVTGQKEEKRAQDRYGVPQGANLSGLPGIYGIDSWPVVEMDSVIGTLGGRVILSLYFQESSMLLLFLREKYRQVRHRPLRAT